MIVKIRGVIYASAKEAAAALGVAENTVYNAAALNKLDTVGLGRGYGQKGKPKKRYAAEFARESAVFRGSAARILAREDMLRRQING